MDSQYLAITLARDAERAMTIIVSALEHNKLALAMRAVDNAQKELVALQGILNRLAIQDNLDLQIDE